MTPRQIADAVVCNILDMQDELRTIPIADSAGKVLVVTDRDEGLTLEERRIKLSDAVLDAMDDLRLKFATGPLDRAENVQRGPGEPRPQRPEVPPPDEELKTSSLREFMEGKL